MAQHSTPHLRICLEVLKRRVPMIDDGGGVVSPKGAVNHRPYAISTLLQKRLFWPNSEPQPKAEGQECGGALTPPVQRNGR